MSNALSRDLGKLVSLVEKQAPDRGRWMQRLHLCPPTGWMNDPNGLCQVDGVFHAFFQYGPFDARGGVKFWGHAESRDLLTWSYVGTPLAPDQTFDCHGVYSGSALIEDGVMHTFYTGNVKVEDGDFDYVDAGREANTVLVESTDGGRTFGAKHLLMTNADYPADLTCHVRDPKVWRASDAERAATGASYLMVQGARRRVAIEGDAPASAFQAIHGERAGADCGQVLLFGSDDLRSWRLVGRVETPERFGFMWECPDYFELADEACGEAQDGLHVLSVSPQGLEGGDWERRNIYQSGYFLLDAPLASGAVPRVEDFHLWDAGFDFYAPQSFEAEDGRRIIIGWMGMPDAPEQTNKTLANGWQHCLTLPREVAAENGRALQRPVRELDALRHDEVRATGSLSRTGDIAFDLVIEGIQDDVSVCLAGDLRICWNSADGRLSLAFGDQTQEGIGGGRSTRWEPVERLQSLRIVGDASSVEVFANRGELAMATRYYPEAYSVAVDAPAAGICLWSLA